MAEERFGKVRKKKILKFGGDGEKNGSSQLHVPTILVPEVPQRRCSYFAIDRRIIQDLELDTNRLDYFDVRAFDVFGDDNLTRNGSDGGDGGSRRDRGVAVGPIPETEICSGDTDKKN
ncbi:hypothetical protein L2E82_18342 [Cichorium intybus]|uniref:Uncharacterized protein n=1 Tax=Cichorium intybus TaxID=13427 RepID=A0ACB9FAU2_CICIN|nr:hypothetical protein L2E82_18342 [Cichorium intybus]